MRPTLFLSHGSPTLPLDDAPASRFLRTLGDRLGRPKAIVVASAHWLTREPAVSAMPRNTTIHDFGGFPRALYEMRYDAPGAPALAARIAALLHDAGFDAAIDPARGLDHGAWVPLSLMYPDAGLPVLQVSVQPHLGPAHALRVGHALAALPAEDVLVIGSGSFTHDLSRISRGNDTPPADVVAFADWFDRAIVEQRTADLLDYRRRAPHAADEHPTEEHLLPLFVALGAAGDHATAERLHASTMHGVLRMDAYAFSQPTG